jgi:predicted DNA-binding protein
MSIDFYHSYYVYVLSTPDGEVVYVGKGTRGRSKVSRLRPTDPDLQRLVAHWKERDMDLGWEIVFSSDDETAALIHEANLIESYGIKHLGTGTLLNRRYEMAGKPITQINKKLNIQFSKIQHRKLKKLRALSTKKMNELVLEAVETHMSSWENPLIASDSFDFEAGNISSAEKGRPTSMILPEETYLKLMELAAINGLSLSALVRISVEKHFFID